MIRELEKSEATRRRERLKLGGIMTAAVGIALMLFLGLAAAHSM